MITSACSATVARLVEPRQRLENQSPRWPAGRHAQNEPIGEMPVVYNYAINLLISMAELYEPGDLSHLKAGYGLCTSHSSEKYRNVAS